MKKLSIKTKAFTLAEVLITLGIIGVVAALTIPTLMNNINDAQFKTAYKKAISTASQALLLAYNDGDLTMCTTWGDAACNHSNFIAFKNQMKISKDCGNNAADCWDMSSEKLYSGLSPANDSFAFIDSSGAAWASINNASTAPEVVMDMNGFKKPNQFGKDRFFLELQYVVDKANNLDFETPRVGLYPDCTGVVPADRPDLTVVEQAARCPSYAKHPCYYTSWITGAQ